MDEFDDNGWDEIWEVFGKDPKRSSYPDENEDDNVEDQFWFEEIPDEFQFTSTWSEETNGYGKQVTSHEEIELRDENPVDDPIHNELVGPTLNKECQSEIHDIDEASPEYDPFGQEFTGDANDGMMKECDQDDTENDPIGEKFTGDSNDGMMKECDQDDTENDPIGQKLTGDANDGMKKQCDQDDTENDPIGEKITGDANDGMKKQCDQDGTANDPVGQKFTSDANYEIIKECVKDDVGNDSAELEYTSNAKVLEFDQNIATPDEAKTDFSAYENVADESDDVLPAQRKRPRSHRILESDKSANIHVDRKTSLGISRYKVLFPENLLPGTLSERWKTSSIKISFQTAFLFAGFFSFISGTQGENISPQDTFATIGSTIRFQCSWDLKKPVYWEWTPVNSKTGVFLYIGNGGLVDIADDRITIDIDRDQGRYDLVITDVLMKHAGTYNCIENSGLGKSVSAELITLDDWNCSMDMPPGGFMGENVVNIPEDSILASCSLRFSGNKDPAIRWSLWKNVSHKNATVAIKRAFTVVSAFSIRPTKELDKSVIIAKVEGSVDSSLIVDGQSWTSEILTVNYVHLVEGAHQGPLDDTKKVLCNPECSFVFQPVYYGATYRYGEQTYDIPLALDNDTPAHEGESKWMIMLIVSIVLFVATLCLLLFLVFFARFKARKVLCVTDRRVKAAASETQSSRESVEFIGNQMNS